ncbi:MAG: hypothetical protein ACLRZ7_06060 [Lachnospiraceae bacterium]
MRYIVLSEVFLSAIGGDFTDENVIHAIEVVDYVLRKRLELRKKLLTESRNGSICNKLLRKNELQKELIDFWDVFKEFDFDTQGKRLAKWRKESLTISLYKNFVRDKIA